MYFPWGHDITTYQLTVNSSLLNNDYSENNFQSLIPNSTQLTQKLLTSLEKTQCYILSLLNPSSPHFKQIRCSDTILKSFYCINPEKKNIACDSPLSHNNNNHDNKSTDIVIKKKCSSGEIISSLYFCDGYKDCLDGSDELNCTCYINGKVINDNNFCSKKCSLSINCSCSILFTNNVLSGCVSFKNSQVIDMEKSNNSSLLDDIKFNCGTIKISKDATNDLLFDCPNGDDEPELKSIFPPILRIGHLMQGPEQVSEYEIFVFLINLCDLLTGCYILGIAVKDFVSGDNYTETDLSLRRSIVCQGLAFILLWSIVLSAFFMSTVSISRYRVVVNPFHKPFSAPTIKLISFCIPILFLILVTIIFIVRDETEELIYISSPLCTLL